MRLILPWYSMKQQFPEFVHTEIHPRTSRFPHACQGLLVDFRQNTVRQFLFPVTRQKQQCAGQAFFAGVE